MLKKKKLKSKNKSYNYKPKAKKIRALKFYSKSSFSFLKPKFHKIIKTHLRRPINYYILIKVTPNNIFCVLKNINRNKTIILWSAGILHIQISKKKLKYAGKILITKFVEKIKATVKNKMCSINISAPVKTRKFALRHILSSLKRSKMLINSLSKKIFNGCRAKKKRRKKRKGLRVFK